MSLYAIGYMSGDPNVQELGKYETMDDALAAIQHYDEWAIEDDDGDRLATCGIEFKQAKAGRKST